MAQPTNVTARGRIQGPWYGTLTVTTGNKAAGAWQPIGPVLANHIGIVAEFTGTTGIVKLQGCVTTGSTVQIAVASRTFAQRGTVVMSTVATVIAFIRTNSTSVQAGKTITCTYAASV